MKKFLLSISMLVIFAGCAANNMAVMNNNCFVLSVSDNKSILTSEVLESKNLRFSSPLIVEQSILKNGKNRILFLEKVSIDYDYMFNLNKLNSIDYIFDAKKVSVLYNNNTVLLVQIKTVHGVTLNILAYSNSIKSLSYIYGFSNDEFEKIAKEIIKDTNTRLPLLKNQGKIMKQGDKPFSRWSETKLIVKPFIGVIKWRRFF